MIKCDNAKVEMKGDVFDLTTDFSYIVKALYDSFSNRFGEKEEKEIIQEGLRTGLLTDEELDKELEEIKREFSKRITSTFLKAMLDL